MSSTPTIYPTRQASRESSEAAESGRQSQRHRSEQRHSPPHHAPCSTASPAAHGTMLEVCRWAGKALRTASARLVGTIEVAFYWYGRAVATVPILAIVLCLVLTAVSGIGLVKFQQETRPIKLWTPHDSEFVRVQEWKDNNFVTDKRLNMAIYEADNVLDKSVLLEMLRVHEVLATTTTSSGSTWNTTCWRVSALPTFSVGRRRRRREANASQGRHKRSTNGDSDSDLSSILPRQDYCKLLESLDEVCLESGLLGVFGYNRDFLANLTQEQILKEVNDAKTSVITGFPLNLSRYLARIERDINGYIVRAGAASHTWFTRVNRSALEGDRLVNDAGTGAQVDVDTQEWEERMVINLLDATNRPPKVKFYLMSASSYGTVSGNHFREDLHLLTFGLIIVFVFVLLMLGRRNHVEARPLLSLLGLTCIGMAVLISYGLCSACNIPYGPVNSIIPFLMLGLGIDDMFIILEEWRCLTPEEQEWKLEDRIGAALGRAGVAITVTSLTDFLAFAVASTTDLPALRYFCIYSAVGIASIYFLQATYFVAWLTLDQRRLEDRRHGMLWCWKMSPAWSPSACSQHDLCHEFFSRVYVKALMKPGVRIVVLLLTGVMFGASIWGLANLRQEFDPIWFLPHDSYLHNYFEKQREYFPSSEEPASVYFFNISLVEELPKMQRLAKRLRDSKYVARVDSWVDTFVAHWGDALTADPSVFPNRLTRFLFSAKGAHYRDRNFRFNTTLECLEDAPPITATSIDFSYKLMPTSQDQVEAMEAVRDIVHGANMSGEVRVWARAYATWETNKIIKKELYRNMAVVTVVVAMTTVVLLASLAASGMVVLCVVFTMVDVAALIHWWGMTIDIVSCIDLVLAVGLCVDYAAHVAHTFLTKTGDRSQRAADTLAIIGPPVLSGGFSTFLAFVFLSDSSSHVYQSFFKVCFGVCLFGLYHGLVFLPALLAFIGPQTHASVAPYPGTPRTPRTPSTASRILSHPRDKKDCDNDGDRDEKFRVEETVEAVSWEDDVRGVSTVEGQDDGPAQAS